MLVGVDIGGTFTDLVLSQADGLTIHKIPSTPDNPASAMLAGLEMLTGGQLDALRRVAHGSTVATNAILERKGARTALITTQGFRDVLLIGRQDRPDLYALQPRLPQPLIPRDLCFEVPERLDHRGDVLTPLDIAALDSVLDQLAALDVESVAVCLLYSYVDPTHEQRIRQRIIERGILAEWQVALSSDVLPEFREYERASTVTLEAYVRPTMARYTSQLYDSLPGSVRLRIMKSDGGVISAQRVARQSIHTALSGPAAGVIGAYAVARAAGHRDIITLDMGGTSTDVSICPGNPSSDPNLRSTACLCGCACSILRRLVRAVARLRVSMRGARCASGRKVPGHSRGQPSTGGVELYRLSAMPTLFSDAWMLVTSWAAG